MRRSRLSLHELVHRTLEFFVALGEILSTVSRVFPVYHDINLICKHRKHAIIVMYEYKPAALLSDALYGFNIDAVIHVIRYKKPAHAPTY